MILAKFRDRYPQGSLVSKLVKIDRGIYIVRVSITVNNITLVSSLAGASTVEAAEDAARTRAISTLFLDQAIGSHHPVKSAPEISTHQSSPTPQPLAAAADNTDNVVNFYKPSSDAELEPTAKATAEIEPNAPTFVPKAAKSVPEPTPEPIPEPTLEPTPPSESMEETENLFAGTFEEDSLEKPNFVPEIITAENTATAATSEPISEPLEMADFDFNQVKQKTDIEIERLGWTRDDGREFLQSRYGKRSRLHLKNEELLEFLYYLEKQPTPVS